MQMDEAQVACMQLPVRVLEGIEPDRGVGKQRVAITEWLDGGGHVDATYCVENEAGESVGGLTLLMCMCDQGHEKLAKLLLLRGAAVEAQTSIGGTALMFACHKGHTQAAELLLVRRQAVASGVGALLQAPC